MKKLLFIAFLIIFSKATSQDNEDLKNRPLDFFVIEGDTIVRSEIDLKEVIVFQPLRFDNYEEAKRYVLLRRRTRKVYPYAKLAAERMNVLSERLQTIKSKRKRKVYIKRMESFVYDEFEEDDGISHQVEGGLKLVIGYEMQEDNSCRLTASIK